MPPTATEAGPVLTIEMPAGVIGTPAEAESLAELGSDADETAAVLVIVVPAPPVTFTTRLNCAEALEFMLARVQLMAPVLPALGAEQVNEGPLFCVSDANVVFDGRVSVHAAFCAAEGPLFVTVMV